MQKPILSKEERIRIIKSAKPVTVNFMAGHVLPEDPSEWSENEKALARHREISAKISKEFSKWKTPEQVAATDYFNRIQTHMENQIKKVGG